jgi:signal transduction histidine kinase
VVKPITRAREPLTSRLFLRIYATFVVSVLVFAALAGLLVWVAASSWDDERIAGVIAQAEASGQPLARAVLAEQPREILAIVAALEAELDAEISVIPRVRGRRLGPPIGSASARSDGEPGPELPLGRGDFQRLHQGLPIVHRRGLAPPTIGLALFESGFTAPAALDDEDDVLHVERGRLIAIVAIEPQRNPRRHLVVVAALLLLALAGGAWPLARSLTSRLAKLERSTRALARGELSHRAELSGPHPRDEVDRLAVAFNEMAERLETLLTGQRTLLANVSHELRTPIARIKVLVEILGDRVERLRGVEQLREHGDADQDIARLERGFAEMDEDLAEVEGLIQDLLTSGRLELGRDSALALETIELSELCEAAASRFAATVECPPELRIHGDRLLLERLLKNLLVNARRHCPEGEVAIRATREADEIVVEIEDEGPGIPAAKRSYIFEPFARLDSARARDEGGVGLGLYLCRQIVDAHGGSIRVDDRRDGRDGARFVVRLRA